jgi:uncharacterized membrane protein YdbT with pleckstrin-like domain
MEQEKIVWQGAPSQLINTSTFILCFLFCWLIVPIFVALTKWLQVKCTKYQVTSERIQITKGILSKRTDELELYRVKDTVLVEPFFLRLFKLSNILLYTSDKSTPGVLLQAIPDGKNTREELRRAVEIMRDKKGVREIDMR